MPISAPSDGATTWQHVFGRMAPVNILRWLIDIENIHANSTYPHELLLWVEFLSIQRKRFRHKKELLPEILANQKLAKMEKLRCHCPWPKKCSRWTDWFLFKKYKASQRRSDIFQKHKIPNTKLAKTCLLVASCCHNRSVDLSPSHNNSNELAACKAALKVRRGWGLKRSWGASLKHVENAVFLNGFQRGFFRLHKCWNSSNKPMSKTDVKFGATSEKNSPLRRSDLSSPRNRNCQEKLKTAKGR